MAEARQNPLSALPAAGAAGVAGLALFAAASSLSPTVVPEGGEYRGLGIGQDGIVRVGFPAGGEQCTNQISRRFSITTCTPSTRRLLDGVAVRFSDRAIRRREQSVHWSMRTGEEAINRGLAKRLQQLSEERARAARAAAAEDEEFSAEFLSMARQVFQMIDKDNSGTLVKAEMSARSVRPSTRARRGSHAIDATRCLPRDPPAASRP